MKKNSEVKEEEVAEGAEVASEAEEVAEVHPEKEIMMKDLEEVEAKSLFSMRMLSQLCEKVKTKI